MFLLMRRFLLLATAALGAALVVVLCYPRMAAQSEPDAPSAPALTPVERVQQAVEALAKRPSVVTGTVGFYLAPLTDHGTPLATRDAQQSFITASTMKTLTTGSALELLGPDFRFRTELRYDPSTGDLLLRGAGDPSLGRPEWEPLFATWTEALRAAGIREIWGRVIADESAWESQAVPNGWTWIDLGNYYAPPLTPLCFHNNETAVFFRLNGRPGAPAGFYDCDPWPEGLRFIDEVLIGVPGSGDNAYAYGAPGSTRYYLRGTLATDAGRDAIRVALPDPALFAVQRFTAWLRAHEIPVHRAPTTTRRLAWEEPDWQPPPTERLSLLAVHESDPLPELLIPINHLSLNLDCECLLRTIGDGSAQRGLARLREHLRQKGLPLAGYEQTDGSGLSRTNMITPELLARANASFLTGPHGTLYRASLPVVGESRSTLRRIQTSGQAEIRAKSGSVERVKAYTGVVTAADGSEYVFAIMVNNYQGPYSRISAEVGAVFEALSDL